MTKVLEAVGSCVMVKQSGGKPSVLFCETSDAQTAATFVELYNTGLLQLGVNIGIGVQSDVARVMILIARRSAKGVFAEDLNAAFALLPPCAFVKANPILACVEGRYASIGELLGDWRINHLRPDLQKVLLMAEFPEATVREDDSDETPSVCADEFAWPAEVEDFNENTYLCTNLRGAHWASFIPVEDWNRLTD